MMAVRAAIGLTMVIRAAIGLTMAVRAAIGLSLVISMAALGCYNTMIALSGQGYYDGRSERPSSGVTKCCETFAVIGIIVS
jgi:hypothetical protein